MSGKRKHYENNEFAGPVFRSSSREEQFDLDIQRRPRRDPAVPPDALEIQEDGPDGSDLDEVVRLTHSEDYYDSDEDKLLIKCLREGKTHEDIAVVLTAFTDREWTRTMVTARKGLLERRYRARATWEKFLNAGSEGYARAVLSPEEFHVWADYTIASHRDYIGIVQLGGKSGATVSRMISRVRHKLATKLCILYVEAGDQLRHAELDGGPSPASRRPCKNEELRERCQGCEEFDPRCFKRLELEPVPEPDIIVAEELLD